MKNMTIKFFIPAFVWAAAIAVVSSIPDLGAPPVVGLTISDKLAHFTEYFILAGAVAFGFHRSGSRWPILWVTLLIGILFGASDEIHQAFVHGRSSEFLDLVADTIGSTAGAGAYLLLKDWIGKIIPWGYRASNARGAPQSAKASQAESIN
jgi:VanZ family protein